MYSVIFLTMGWATSAWAQEEGGEAPLEAPVGIPGEAGGEATGPSAAAAPHEATTRGNHIDIWFRPKNSAYVGPCDQIVHVQTLQMFADGKMILPGTFEKSQKRLDPTASDGGFVIDTKNTNEPWYTAAGRAVPSTSDAPLWMDDTPLDRDSADFPRYNEETNPTGWKDMYWSFKTYAYCSKGPQCGTWYDGVWWTVFATAADFDAGRVGTAKVVALNLPPADPNGDVRQAFERYLSVKGQARCE